MRRLPFLHIVAETARVAPLLIVSAFVEKNVAKRVGFRTPVVFSMTRLIVCAFAVAMIRQVWKAGIAGWPEATLSVAIVLAIPVSSALDRVRASDVVRLAGTLIGRFGEGGTRGGGSVYPVAASDAERNRSQGHEEQEEAA